MDRLAIVRTPEQAREQPAALRRSSADHESAERPALWLAWLSGEVAAGQPLPALGVELAGRWAGEAGQVALDLEAFGCLQVGEVPVPGWELVSPVSVSFWHAAGTGHASRCELPARPCSRSNGAP